MGFIINPYQVQPSGGGSIVTDGLILNLDAGNSSSYSGSGTTWTDLSASGYNGTLTNGVSYSSDNNGILIFDGINDYVSINSFTMPSSFSVGMFVKIDYANSTSFARLIEKGLNNEFSINLNKNAHPNKYTFQLFNGDILLASTTSVSSTSYQYIVMTNQYTSGTNSYKMYLNATEEASGSKSGSFSSSNNLYIGGNPGSITLTATAGNIPVVHMYNKALTGSEIDTNFNALKSRYGL